MLRVSTNTLFRTGEQNILRRQQELLAAQTQLSSGKRINAPSDDPLGAADASAIRTNLSQFEQFKDNQGHARYLLNLGESALAAMIGAVQDARQKLVAAGNGAYGDGERQMIAADLEGILGRMVGLANSSDGANGYLFAGAREGVTPFVQSGNAVGFRGDGILQRLEVANDRFLQVKFSGDLLFNKMRPGNGSFTTAAAAANSGTGRIDVGSVVDPSQFTARPYRIVFGAGGSYTVERFNADATVTTVAAGTYTAPQTVEFDGIRVTLDGAPAAGDAFDLAPSGFRSVFDTVALAIAELRQPVQTDPPAAARLHTALGGLQASLDQAHDHLLVKRAEIGTALQELDAYEQLNDGRQLEYQTRLSAVEDLDFARGAAELARRQGTFEAALKSYSAVSRLSLFDYL